MSFNATMSTLNFLKLQYIALFIAGYLTLSCTQRCCKKTPKISNVSRNTGDFTTVIKLQETIKNNNCILL